MLDLPQGRYHTQLHRNGLETALRLDRWKREHDLAPE